MNGLAKPGLKHLPPYWHVYATRAKQRWLGRPLVEVLAEEYRDRCEEYYAKAIDAGLVRLNGQVAQRDTTVRNADILQHIVHRHEPPVTSAPVRVLHHDKEREFIVVDKPGSLPVHPSGRYFRNSVIEVLRRDHGFDKVYPVNRLDRLTSGLLIFPLTSAFASTLSEEFRAGTVRKEYVARVKGEFPIGEMACDAPLLTVDKQIGLNIVHPDGKPARTVFEMVRYDANTDSSVVLCRPETGRSHQIRVHLQYLGHPIANDQEYADTRLWGNDLAKGGLSPSTKSPPPDSTTPPAPTEERVTDVVERLREIRDERNDWRRWRTLVASASQAIPSFDTLLPTPRRAPSPSPSDPSAPAVAQLSLEHALALLASHAHAPLDLAPADAPAAHPHCPTCLLPSLPDPDPEDLYIFLHARRYTMSLGVFEAGWPAWAEEGWTWRS